MTDSQENKVVRRRVVKEQPAEATEEKVEEMANERVEPPKPRPVNFKMVKIFPGAMGVTLEAYDFSTPPRPFNFPYDMEYKVIPLKWAVGVFVSDNALRQMELGQFTFENLDTLIEMAEELGQYVPDSIKEPKITTKDIKQAVKSNDVQKVEALYSRLNPTTRQTLLAVGRKFYNGLKVEVINSIEKFLGVSLQTVNLDD